MQYIAPAHKASSALDAFVCDFTAENSRDLILNKGNRIQIFRTSESGTSLHSEHPINGILTSLVPLHQPGQLTAFLICATAASDFFALAYDAQDGGKIVTLTSVNIAETAVRPAEHGQIMLKDPIHEAWVALHAFHGVLRLARVKHNVAAAAGKKKSGKRKASMAEADNTQQEDWQPVDLDFRSSFDIRLPDYQVHAITALHLKGEKLPVMAILHDDHLGNKSLKLRPLSVEDHEFVHDPPHSPSEDFVMADPGATLLLPLHDGVVVIGEQSATCYQFFPLTPEQEDEAVNQREQQQQAAASSTSPKSKGKGKGRSSSGSSGPPPAPAAGQDHQRRNVHHIFHNIPLGIYQTACQLPDQKDTFLLSDSHGLLLLLKVIRAADGRARSIHVREMGTTSAATALVPLPGSAVYVASHSGDHQLLQLQLDGNVKQSAGMDVDDAQQASETNHFKLIERQTNIAPIADFVVVENDYGQSHMVTCSGCNADGSLRLISHGVGLTELASFDLEQVQRVWSLLNSAGEDLLVLSSVSDTTLLRLPDPSSEDEVEEVSEMRGFDASLPTLDAFNLPENAGICQVTSTGISSSSGATWAPSAGKISVAAHAGGMVLLALEGAKLVLCQYDTASTAFKELQSCDTAQEVSALTLHKMPNGKAIGAAGLWSSHDLMVMEVPSLNPISKISAASSFVIRSTLACNFRPDAISLFVGIGDGSLLSFNLDLDSGAVDESSAKSVTLGTRPIVMSPYTSKSGPSILVSSDRPTLISKSGTRTNYSPVNLRDINAMCSMASNNSLVLVSPETVRIGRIDDIQSLHIRDILLGEDQPRRIAYSAELRAYGLLCVRESFDRSTGAELSSSSFKIVDETSFEVLLDYELEEEEQGCSVGCVRSQEYPQDFFVIGCATILEGEAQSRRGRLVAFASSSNGNEPFAQLAEVDVSGTPFAIAQLDHGLFAATVNAQVKIMELRENLPSDQADGAWRLEEATKWGGSFISSCLAARGSQVLVGDALRSAVLLKVERQSDRSVTLYEVAREHTCHGLLSVQFIDDDHYIASDHNLNLFTMSRAPTSQPRIQKLQQEGLFHIGEIVTRIAPGSLVPKFSQSSAFKSNQLLYSTSSGSIGVVNELDGSMAQAMSDLQRNMARVAPALGSLQHADWRAFKAEHRRTESVGFVDGSLIQTFADLSDAQVEAVMQGKREAEALTMTRRQLLDAVEELSRAHS